jgi:hypothetical protein
VVRQLLAVQAQDFTSMPLALRARTAGLRPADVRGAIDSGELVISWLNRGTLHLVLREDWAWLHALTAPTAVASNRRRLGEEGVTDPARGVRAIVKALGDGPLLRREIGERVGATGAALTHLLMKATLEAKIVRGPVRGREQTWTLVRDHLGAPPPKVDREKALTELARRYAASHAYATDADLAYWSGLPLRDVRGRMPPTRIQAPRKLPPKLLPPFDPYIMGWKDRSFAIPAEMTRRVMPGGGMFRAVVLVDGCVAGTWSRTGGQVTIDGPPRSLNSEIKDVNRFLKGAA